MRIRRKFIQLTKYTYPHGTEGFLKSYLPKNYKTDNWGNFYLLIGDKPSTMFTCHLDTACTKQERVNHVFLGDFIKTDGKTILGADDKAGMSIILSMIEKNIPGLYYFFLGEEVGCIGSGKVAANWHNLEFSDFITKCVSFDRRGTKSVITHQFCGRCCSDEFAQDLADKLNLTGNNLSMELDNSGFLTDSAKFVELIPECTNISVGYYNEHTKSEKQDLAFLQALSKAVCQIDWESLVVKRTPDDDDDCDDELPDFEKPNNLKFDLEYYSYFRSKTNEPPKKMYISLDRISQERKLIQDWIYNRSTYFGVKDFHWNGNILHIENSVGLLDFVGYRTDLLQFISELGQVEKKHVAEKLSSKFLVF